MPKKKDDGLFHGALYPEDEQWIDQENLKAYLARGLSPHDYEQSVARIARILIQAKKSATFTRQYLFRHRLALDVHGRLPVQINFVGNINLWNQTHLKLIDRVKCDFCSGLIASSEERRMTRHKKIYHARCLDLWLKGGR